jgi:hypothetical protein
MAWTMARLGIQLPSRIDQYSVNSGSTYSRLCAEFEHIGIFLGTPGPNRKIVVYADNSERAVFIKIPSGELSEKLVRNEANAIAILSSDAELAKHIPSATNVAGHFAVETVETDGVSHKELSLFEVSRICGLIESRSMFACRLHTLRREWEETAVGNPINHTDSTLSYINGARNAARRYLDVLDSELIVQCYFAHGDFTRWNVLRAQDGTARVIDWELFGPKPERFDLIHYYVSQDLLVSRSSPLAVLSRLRAIGDEVSSDGKWSLSVGLYFACQALYYSSLYERQCHLHPQAIHQLVMWRSILQYLANRSWTNAWFRRQVGLNVVSG